MGILNKLATTVAGIGLIGGNLNEVEAAQPQSYTSAQKAQFITHYATKEQVLYNIDSKKFNIVAFANSITPQEANAFVYRLSQINGGGGLVDIFKNGFKNVQLGGLNSSQYAASYVLSKRAAGQKVQLNPQETAYVFSSELYSNSHRDIEVYLARLNPDQKKFAAACLLNYVPQDAISQGKRQAALQILQVPQFQQPQQGYISPKVQAAVIQAPVAAQTVRAVRVSRASILLSEGLETAKQRVDLLNKDELRKFLNETAGSSELNDPNVKELFEHAANKRDLDRGYKMVNGQKVLLNQSAPQAQAFTPAVVERPVVASKPAAKTAKASMAIILLENGIDAAKNDIGAFSDTDLRKFINETAGLAERSNPEVEELFQFAAQVRDQRRGYEIVDGQKIPLNQKLAEQEQETPEYTTVPGMENTVDVPKVPEPTESVAVPSVPQSPAVAAAIQPAPAAPKDPAKAELEKFLTQDMDVIKSTIEKMSKDQAKDMALKVGALKADNPEITATRTLLVTDWLVEQYRKGTDKQAAPADKAPVKEAAAKAPGGVLGKPPGAFPDNEVNGGKDAAVKSEVSMARQ